ncbi:MAG: transglycosylase domain-containing protein [Fimbriimonadales bacterium]|nr:transglycosylase domain-containing protein [Fimbriimonadales bacterium]
MPPRAPVRKVPARRRSSPWKRRLKIFLALLSIVLCVAIAVPTWLFMRLVPEAERQLEKLEEIIQANLSEPSRILSADGKELFRVATEYREPVQRLDEIPLIVRQATLAAEDRRFYRHPGVDPRAVVRSLVTNIREDRFAQGASTITMQLARIVTRRYQKTWDRKLREAALAYSIDRRFTKDQILLNYLNLAYYGSGAYGVKAAARVYFNKSLDRLTVAEAAMLARCLRRPSRENPFDDLQASIRNRNTVLAAMREEGMIDEQTYREAIQEQPRLRRRNFAGGARIAGAPYFVQYVLSHLRAKKPDLDLSLGGYVVTTTLDSALQEVAERQVRAVVEANRRRRVSTGAFLLMDSRGRILAMVGGVDYSRNQYNVITQGRRQPGSSFKPFVYAAALDSGALSPNDRVSNARYVWQDPLSGKVWAPENSGGGYGGPVSLKSAMARSLNVVAVRVAEKAGADTVVDYARRVFGFVSPLDPVLSIALGSSAVSPLEMARGYSVFQHRGNRVEPFGIVDVRDVDGTVVYSEEPKLVPSGLRPEVAEEIDSYLREVVERGTASGFRSQMPPNSRGKTGTTQENRDAWFCGYTDRFLGIGWVGNEVYDEREKRWRYLPMGSRVFGGTVTVQIWAKVVSEAVKRYGDVPPSAGDLAEPPVDVSIGPAEDVPTETLEQPPAEAQEPIDVVPPAADETREPPAQQEQRQGAPPEGQTAVPSVGSVDPDPLLGGEAGPRRIAESPAAAVGLASQPKVAPPNVPRPRETVRVEICADTRLKATIYCPETVVRAFPKGREPRGTCRRHIPDL